MLPSTLFRATEVSRRNNIAFLEPGSTLPADWFRWRKVACSTATPLVHYGVALKRHQASTYSENRSHVFRGCLTYMWTSFAFLSGCYKLHFRVQVNDFKCIPFVTQRPSHPSEDRSHVQARQLSDRHPLISRHDVEAMTDKFSTSFRKLV